MSRIPPQRATRIEAASEGAIAEAARCPARGAAGRLPDGDGLRPRRERAGRGRGGFGFCGEGAAAFQSADRACARARAMRRRMSSFNPIAQKLADAFWPGALTLVLPRREGSPLSLLASAGLDTVALRAPHHPVARALLTVAGIPIAAPSANRAGSVSPTTADHVARDLYGRVDLILDAGPCPIGIESTVIGFESGAPGSASARGDHARGDRGHRRPPRRSGKGRHARPRHDVQPLCAARPAAARHPRGAGRARRCWRSGPTVPTSSNPICNLSPRGDLAEAAANLFAMLRQLDQSGVATIAVMRVPDRGLGEAINDRLRRAAAPREAAP